MLDTGLIVEALQRRGHIVTHMHKMPEDAGSYSFEIDGCLFTLEQARALMEDDDFRNPPKSLRPKKRPVPQTRA